MTRSATQRGNTTTLACPEAEAALEALLGTVQDTWIAVRSAPGGSVGVFEAALTRSQFLLPCGVRPRPLRAVSLIEDLRAALQNHHPEEIQVLHYTLSTHLVEIVRDTCGARQAERLTTTLKR